MTAKEIILQIVAKSQREKQPRNHKEKAERKQRIRVVEWSKKKKKHEFAKEGKKKKENRRKERGN